MKRFMLSAAIIIFVCSTSFAASSKHLRSSSTKLSSKFSSALSLIPGEIKTDNYKVIDETVADNDQEDIDEYDVVMQGKNFKGNVLYNTRGTMLSYRERIKDIQLPAQVTDAVKAKYPDAVFTKDREIIHDDKKYVNKYKVYFKCSKKHGYALADAKGNIIRSRK